MEAFDGLGRGRVRRLWRWVMRPVLRRGRQWVMTEELSWREGGWWLFGYWAWMPALRYWRVAVKYRLLTGENNYFYNPVRRGLLGTDAEIFGWERV